MNFKIKWGPSKLPKIDGEDAGIIRRLMNGRWCGKTETALNEAVRMLKSNYPDCNKMTYVCMDLKRVEATLKNHPNVIRKGRWFYYKYNDELIYIKIIKVEKLSSKNIKIERAKNVRLEDYEQCIK